MYVYIYCIGFGVFVVVYTNIFCILLKFGLFLAKALNNHLILKT